MKRISKIIRNQVALRATHSCEYCLAKDEDSFLPFHIDHIIATKHGGKSDLNNLAFACPHCNQHKGTDLTTVIGQEQKIVPLFNPRAQVWEEHFSIHEGEIIPITTCGMATIKLLRFNDPERIINRRMMIEKGYYP